MNKTMLYFLLIVVITGTQACRHNSMVSYEKKDNDLAMQVGMYEERTDTGDITLRVRILLQPARIAKGVSEDKSYFYYKMDSCFYLRSAKGKIYPSLLQPVANGVKTSFEYLVSFEGPIKKADTLDFVYQDRYINKKNYYIKLN